MQTEISLRHALCPKPVRNNTPILASDFATLVGNLTPAERGALREIIEDADLIEVEGETFLLARVRPQVIAILSEFEAEATELEDGDEDCCSGWDDDPTRSDNCLSCVGAGDFADAEDDDPSGANELTMPVK